MKYSIKLIKSLLPLIGLFFASRASAVTLDLDKFKDKALKTLQQIEPQSAQADDGKIFFRDGTTQPSSLTLPDHSAFFYVLANNTALLPKGNSKLAYRLGLSGEESVMFLMEDPQTQRLHVRFANSGTAKLVKPHDTTEAIDFTKELLKIDPKGRIEYLKFLGLITYDVNPLFSSKIIIALSNSKLVDYYVPDSEISVARYIFDPYVVILDSGKIDADKYRSLTKNLKAQGYKFSTETTVPIDLQ